MNFKRVICVLSILVIGLSFYQLKFLHSPSHGTRAAFSSFPMNQSRPVEINWGDSALQQGSDRDRKDQIRDWLLMAVVADAGLSPAEIRSIALDTPPARFGYLEPLSAFEYGETRSRPIGEGKVVALIPAGQNNDQRADSLAHIADEYQKNSGHQPRELLVFEYDIPPDDDTASIARRETVPGDSFFTEASGYYTAKINDRESLERFLQQIDDVTEAQINDDGVSINGRKLHTGYRGVTIEDVGALWQSESKIQAGKEKAQALEEHGKAFDEKVDAFNNKWQSVTYSSGEEELELIRENRTEKAELEAEKAQLEDEANTLRAEFAHQRPVNGSGFSLDPAYDYNSLYSHAVPLLPLLKGAATDTEISNVLSSLSRHDEGPFLQLLYNIRQKKSDDLILMLLQLLQEHDQFQAARYDGYLQGTRVGMTLFYTDLLAKLKAIDYWDDDAISDFQPLTDVRVSPIYQKEEELLSSTRLWFGPQDRGYQLTDHEILFGRNATRIYAASSDPLQPGKEAAPNASSQRFLGWWDSHYEEVARYEPEYQRLNEIMKWSLLLSWLSNKGHGNTLSYLGNVEVARDLWFPTWAKEDRELRYRDWERFNFYNRGYKGSTTEAMPLLNSRWFKEFGEQHQLRGGVSLGSKEVIQERNILTHEFQENELLLPPGRSFSAANPDEIPMLSGVKHTFKEESGQLLTISRIDMGGVKKMGIDQSPVKFRGDWVELSPASVERAYSMEPGQLHVDLKFGKSDLGRFYAEVSPDRPIRLGFHSREIDQGQQFAEQLSHAAANGGNADAFIAMHPDVEEFVKFGPGMDCDGCFAVKLRGSSDYLKMQREQSASADIAAGWQARAASLDEGAQNFNLAWISKNDLEHELSTADYIKIAGPGNADGGSVPPTFIRGPPPGPPSDWNLRGTIIKVFRDDKNNIYIPKNNLSAALDIQFIVDPNPLKQFIISGESRRALQIIADDPNNAGKIIEEVKTAARSAADHALVEGDLSGIDRNLRVLSNVGNKFEAESRSAIAAAESGDIEGAVRSIREAIQQRARDVDGALDIINRRLQSSILSKSEQDNLNQLASMLDFGSGQAFADHGRIAFDVRLAEEVSNTRVVTSQEIHDSGSPFYVLETPNARPDVAIPAAMPDQVQRDLGRIVQLPRSDLAHARALLIETADGKRYRLAGETGTWRQASTSGPGPGPGGIYRRYSPNAPPCNSSPSGDSGSRDCNHNIYLYSPAPKELAHSR